MKLYGYILTIALLLCLFFGLLWGGYKMYPRLNPGPEITTDTIYLPDTTKHTISDKPPEYIFIRDSIKYRDQVWMDSVIQANKVDTNAMLCDFYAIHYYTRSWKDSLISITRHDAIAENNFINSKIDYQFLKPRTVIQNNVIEYSCSKYIYAGLNLPINSPKYTSLDIVAAFPRGYFGAGYSPGLGTLSIKGGFKIIDIK